MTAPPTDPSGLPTSDPFPPTAAAPDAAPAAERRDIPATFRPNRFVVAFVILAAVAAASYLLSRPSKPSASHSGSNTSAAGQATGPLGSAGGTVGTATDGTATGLTPSSPGAHASSRNNATASSQGLPTNCATSTLATAATLIPVHPQAGDALRSASYTYTASTTPQVEIGGHLTGPLPKGSHLFTADWADPTSTDSTADHSPGNARYYPATELRPSSDLCFHQARHAIGYPGFAGIQVRIYVLLVNTKHARTFQQTGAEQDGYTSADLTARGAVPIAYFTVPTK